jgi:hypothetical protein
VVLNHKIKDDFVFSAEYEVTEIHRGLVSEVLYPLPSTVTNQVYLTLDNSCKDMTVIVPEIHVVADPADGGGSSEELHPENASDAATEASLSYRFCPTPTMMPVYHALVGFELQEGVRDYHLHSPIGNSSGFGFLFPDRGMSTVLVYPPGSMPDSITIFLDLLCEGSRNVMIIIPWGGRETIENRSV